MASMGPNGKLVCKIMSTVHEEQKLCLTIVNTFAMKNMPRPKGIGKNYRVK